MRDHLSQRARAVLDLYDERQNENREAVVQAYESLIAVLDHANKYSLHIEHSCSHNED
jgi:hypothetical protein